MSKIPVTFTFEQREYKGYFSHVSGSGTTSMFHLMVDDFYYGQLFLTDDKWKFYSNDKPELSALEDYFGEVVEGNK